MRNLAVSVITALFLAGCATASHDVVVIDPRPPITPPVVEPVNPKPVNWMVLNSQSLRQLADRAEETGENVVLYVLDSDGFRALATNLADIHRYIREQNEAIGVMVEANKGPVATDD